MPRLGAHGYGKSEIRVVKVVRGPGQHEVRDLTVDVMLRGAFAPAYVEGDTAGLLATDTMRNTVYAFAQEHPLDELESFGEVLVEHFLAAGPTVTGATVHVREHPWARLGEHPHAFQRGHGGTRIAEVSADDGELRRSAGVEDLLVLETTGSGWAGFHRERFNTLPETDDRILATAIAASWDYAPDADLAGLWPQVRDGILAAFADHYSPSVQFTLHRMGSAVLQAHPGIERVRLALPNRHHLPFDLARFGLEDRGQVFHATTEPYGIIEGTVERSG